MNWQSWSNFFHIGGYGFYVWGSYLVTGLCIAAELAWLSQRRRTLRAQLTQMLTASRYNHNET